MNTSLLMLAGTLVLSMTSLSQTTIFQDDFESGSGSWTLNGGSGLNEWTVNNAYTGLSGAVEDTPDQPATITGFPHSTYMHIANSSACAGIGLCNASYDPGSVSSQFTQLTTSINTTGFNTVVVSFWYLCDGAAGTAFGTLEYSLDNGSSWITTGTYQGNSTWTHANIANPAWINIASLKFRFKWQNDAAGGDPAFAVDQFKISGISGNFANIAIDSISSADWCHNTASNITVDFTATGTINPGNNFTVQLSDAAGSFATAVNIGSMAGTSPGSFTINAVIPAGIATGNSYRIRVNASNPVTTGAGYGTYLAVHPLPAINVTGTPVTGFMCPGGSVTMLASGGVGYSWLPAGSLDDPWGTQVIATPGDSAPYTVTGTDENGCTNTATFVVTMQNCMDIAEKEDESALQLYPNPVNELLHLRYEEALDIRQIHLLDQSGRIIAAAEPGTTEINTAALSAGSYLVRLTHADGASMARFVKE